MEFRFLDDRADASERLAALRRLRQAEEGDVAGGGLRQARPACGSWSSCLRRSGRGSRRRHRPARAGRRRRRRRGSPNFFVSALVSITVSMLCTVRAPSAGGVGHGSVSVPKKGTSTRSSRRRRVGSTAVRAGSRCAPRRCRVRSRGPPRGCGSARSPTAALPAASRQPAMSTAPRRWLVASQALHSTNGCRG